MENTTKVNAFMAGLEHPLKAELEAVCKIIREAAPGITEDIKWGGPSYAYKGDMATINPKIMKYVAVIFHKGDLLPKVSDFFEEATKGKVYAKFYDMAAVKANKKALQQMVRNWVQLMGQ
ncbi:DUF1801 domain-containing protein [Taibaiella chishuiensis]|nr:DUF1801 domain-containing protein [Taibaiella chishuiensis]